MEVFTAEHRDSQDPLRGLCRAGLRCAPRPLQDRRAERPVERSPWDFAFASSSSQSFAGKRTDRGTVGPVSFPLAGRPRPTWIPSTAMRAACGFRRARAASPNETPCFFRFDNIRACIPVGATSGELSDHRRGAMSASTR